MIDCKKGVSVGNVGIISLTNNSCSFTKSRNQNTQL